MDDCVILKDGEHGLKRNEISHQALQVLWRLDEAGYKAYLCGGGVRDLLLGRQPKDYDIATDARPEEIKKLFRNSRIIGRRFKLAHIFYRDVIIETATFRALFDAPPPEAEGIPLPSRRRTDVPDPTFATRDGVIVRDNVYGTPEEDARRRDFTINGLFYNIADGSIIDYVGGLVDLEKRVLRMIGDPETRIHEDPVRMVRAIRIAAQLDFQIEPALWDAIRRLGEDLKNSSRERMHEEVLKILNCGSAKAAFSRSWQQGLFQTIYPSFSAWLGSPEGAASFPWVKKALRQFDVWKQANLKPMPALQHALVFGPYIEARAAELAAEGVPEFEAALQAVHATLRDKSNLTQISKAIVFDVERILSLQVQMRKSSGQSRYATRLRKRNGFEEALIYLKFASGMEASRKDLLERWMAPAQTDAGGDAKGEGGKAEGGASRSEGGAKGEARTPAKGSRRRPRKGPREPKPEQT
ncbi:MAG: polynucleotide adenylyltransferase PcnB [Lentisphaerae bacterium]|jgi:poly(A) polymerase|nr:polynucleotide adenylyltransferase PcnB [Lentisphaerota bacterium]